MAAGLPRHLWILLPARPAQAAPHTIRFCNLGSPRRRLSPRRRADDAMSSALEAAGADAPKRQKRPGTGIVASLGREILLQARALDKASGVKFGVEEDGRSWPRTWITKVQQTASVPVYTVSVKKDHYSPIGARTSVHTATFKDLSNAIESFMTAANPDDDCQRDVLIMAFKVWEERSRC